MVEVGFKRPASAGDVSLVTAAFQKNGIDGFTLAKDARGNVIGIRAQYVPEISARFESLDHLNPDQFALNAMDWMKKTVLALDLLKGMENVSYREEGYVATSVYGHEEYATAKTVDLRGSSSKNELGRRLKALSGASK